MNVQCEIQSLDKREIDRRIQDVVDCVASEAQKVAAGDLTPRWIRAEILVRRMRPYLSSN